MPPNKVYNATWIINSMIIKPVMQMVISYIINTSLSFNPLFAKASHGLGANDLVMSLI